VGLLVEILARHDAPISLGSDAHLPNSVGRVRAVLPLLRGHGVRHLARFAQRRMELVPLPTDA
jgi:histidinol-phosphatase (PHP family)